MMQFRPAPARGGIPMKTTLLFRRFSIHPPQPIAPAPSLLRPVPFHPPEPIYST
jgi:hypothetical protein